MHGRILSWFQCGGTVSGSCLHYVNCRLIQSKNPEPLHYALNRCLDILYLSCNHFNYLCSTKGKIAPTRFYLMRQNRHYHKYCILHNVFLLLSQLFNPLLGRTISRGRRWAAIQLSHRPESPGRAVHDEVDGLGIGGQLCRRFVLLRHTHRPQRRPYPICTSMSGNVPHQCGGG